MGFDNARRQELREKLGEFASTRDPQLRQELVEAHLGLAEYLARRFANRGLEHEVLVQVASEALLKAVDRFDPTRGVEFSTYATRTIFGELKRHFRDKTWAVRAPRRLQELYLNLGWAISHLSQRYGRSPTITELATETRASEEEVLEAFEAGEAYRFSPLPAPPSTQDGGDAPGDYPGEDDANLAGAEDRLLLYSLVPELPPRQQLILYLRFYEDMTQTAIAERLGISQMHVSRLLSRALGELRARARQADVGSLSEASRRDQRQGAA